ncbi:unnamed protein product [Symbiodinium natans]|uniref:Uncharacterized protein n=1 Tax=Symbiodinium natans TaxID=878477 RepID=A0A812MBN6_9DINO|nr:unnamed protein product [Symbiodinium natans]
MDGHLWEEPRQQNHGAQITYLGLLALARRLYGASKICTNLFVPDSRSVFNPARLDKLACIHARYGVIMLFGVSFLSPWHTTPNQAFTFNFFLVVFFRVPGAILCTRLIWALLFNSLYLAMMTTRVLTESEDFPPTLKPDVVIITECLICTLVLVCTMALHGLLSRRAEMNLHRKNANTQLSAAQSLLRLTCDAVVELDGDLCLTKHCPELAAMLLKGRCNLEGKKLTEFMPPMEVLRAEENLRRFSDDDPEPAQAFHTRLVDSISSRLCIELFQVQYKEMDGRHCHLVGIRDFTDSPGLLAANSEMSLADPFEEPLRWQSSVPFVEVDVESTSTASASSGGEEPRGAKKVFLEIDMTDMRVQAASAPVDAVVGLTAQFTQNAHVA